MSGQSNFLARLAAALTEMKLPPHQILVPIRGLGIEAGKVVIGRFDGAFIYRTTPSNSYNLVRAVKFNGLPRLRFLEKSGIGSLECLDRMAARYLNRYDRLLKSRADAYVYQSLLSKKEHEFVHGDDHAPKLTRMIPNGVPCDLFSRSQRRSSGVRGGPPALVITAHFRIGKRLRDAIIILNVIRKRKNSFLHIVGDLDILVQESIADLDLSGCVFHGRVPSESLPDIYSSMDLGLSTSLFDPCPNSVIEMLACGVPVLTSSASGAAELVPDQRFIISEDVPLAFTEFHNYKKMPALDHQKWVERIELVLNDRLMFSELSTDHAKKNFDINIIATKYAELITETWDENNKSIGGHVRP